MNYGLALLGLAALNDEAIARLAEATGLLPLNVSPWGAKVLATTTGLGLAFTTTIGVVDGVHRHTANSGTNTLPACATRLAGRLVHVLSVAYLTDGAVAVFMELADFTGRKLDKGISCLAVAEDGLLTGSAGYLAAASGANFDIVDNGTEGYALERHGVAYLGGYLLAGDNCCSYFKSGRSQNVGLYSVGVGNEGDAAAAVGIVFDRIYSCRDIGLVTLEVYETVLTLMTSADVAHGDASGVVTTTGLFKRLAKTLLRLAGGNFFKRRPYLVAVRGSYGIK